MEFCWSKRVYTGLTSHCSAAVCWAPGPMVSERAPAFVHSDTLHWAMKSVKQAVEHRCSMDLYVVCSVKCAVCSVRPILWLVTFQILWIVPTPPSLYCVLCPAGQPSVQLNTGFRPSPHFTASLTALPTEERASISTLRNIRTFLQCDNSGCDTFEGILTHSGYIALSWIIYSRICCTVRIGHRNRPCCLELKLVDFLLSDASPSVNIFQ